MRWRNRSRYPTLTSASTTSPKGHEEVRGDPAPPSARIQPAGCVDRLLEAAKRGDDAAISGMSRDHLQDDPGKAWLESGRERLQQQEHARPHVPEQVDRSYQAEGVGVAR